MTGTRLRGILAAAAAAVILTACGGGGAESGPSGTESGAVSKEQTAETRDPYFDVSGKKVGISFPSEKDERWSRDGAWLKARLEAEGCSCDLRYADAAEAQEAQAASGSETEFSPAAQQALDVAALLNNGCELLIINSIGDDLIAESLAQAGASDIPVIAYDHLIRGSDAVKYFVSFDHYGMGCLEGKYVIDQLSLTSADASKLYHIEFAAGDPSDVRDSYIFNGAYDTLKPYFDAGLLEAATGDVSFKAVQTEGSSADAARARLETVLSENYADGPELSAIICTNDEVALGAVKAVESAYKGKNKVIITGEGGSADTLANVKAGKQAMTVCEDEAEEADVTLSLALTLLNGDVADANVITDSEWDFDCRYDTSSYDNGRGIVPAYLLAPYVETSASLK